MDFEKLYELIPVCPKMWESGQVSRWLSFIGLSQFQQQFGEQQAIDGSCIFLIEEQELVEDMGIKNAIQRKKIMNWINNGLQQYIDFVKEKSNRKDSIDYNSRFTNTLYTPGTLQMNTINNIDKALASNTVQNVFDNNIFKELQASNQYIEQTIQSPEDEGPVFDNAVYQKKGSGQEEKNKGINEPQKVSRENPILQRAVSRENINPQRPAPAKQQVILRQIDENHKNKWFMVEQGKIGRHSSNQVVILEESVSRFHAQILREPSGLFCLKDVGSTTGTFLKIKKSLPLSVEMIVEMGSNQFRVTSLQPPLVSLLITEGPDRDKLISLDLSLYSHYKLGRKPSNDLSFGNDQHMSSIHSQLFLSQNTIILEDLGSTNGSWLRLSPEGLDSVKYSLEDNGVFKVGANTTFRVYTNNLCVSCQKSNKVSPPRHFENCTNQQHVLFCTSCANEAESCLICPPLI